jgi:zinc protease
VIISASYAPPPAAKIVSEAYSKFLEAGPAGDVSPRKSTFLGGLDDTIKHCDSLATTGLQTLVDGSPIDRALKLKTEVEAITSATLKERLSTAFPRPDQFVIVAVAPDSNALPGACVITRPEDAVNCK